jgi:hypothetical protein
MAPWVGAEPAINGLTEKQLQAVAGTRSWGTFFIFRTRMDDGAGFVAGPGNNLPPQRVRRVVGKEPVVIDWFGASSYAKQF